MPNRSRKNGSRKSQSPEGQYLRGGALQATKQAFRRVGVTFTRKAAERAIPFGIGVVVAGGANYGLSRYVGHQAKEWFIIDRTVNDDDMDQDDEGSPATRDIPSSP